MSFKIAGRDIFMKSLCRRGLCSNMYLMLSLTSLLRADTIKHSTNCSTLEIAVARATPISPSFGAPKRPKMNTAFRATLVRRADASSTVTIMVRPTDLRIEQ